MNGRFKVETLQCNVCTDLLRALALGTMAGSIGFALGRLLGLILPWSVTYLTLVAGLTAVEAYYSLRVSQEQSLYQIEAWRFRAIELTLLFILVKLGSYIGQPWAAVLADVAAWPSDLTRLFDPQTVVAALLAFLTWLFTLQSAQDLQQLDEPGEYHLRESPAIGRLRTRFLIGGLLLLVLTGVARVGVAALLDMGRPPVSGLVLNVLLYFVVGLIMLGQVWFATLLQGWRLQKIEVASELAPHWLWYTLLFCLLAGLLAFLLPTRYTSSTFGIVLVALEAFFTVFQFIFTILMFLLALLFWLLSQLLHLSNAPRPAAPAAPAFPAMPNQVRGAGWLTLLRDLAFWIVLLAALFYIVRTYLRDHPEIGRALASLAPLRWLRALWRWLVRSSGEWRVKSREWRLFSRRRREIEQGATRRGPRLGRRALSFRERIWYYYLQVLRRAERQGFPRRSSETPAEYSQALAPHLAEARPELEQLTAAFIKARYSDHPVEATVVSHVRAWGRQIRRALRGLQLRRVPDQEHGQRDA